MRNVDVVVSLPPELVERARTQGLLNNERIALLLEAEIERIGRWHNLDQALEPVREAFRAEHGEMTEDDVIAMINETVHEVRTEYGSKDAGQSTPS